MATENIESLDENEILTNIEDQEFQKLKEALKHLCTTWKEIGMDKNQKILRAQTAWSHIQCLVKDICDEEEAVCEDLKTQVKDYMQKITEFSKVLSVNIPDLTDLPLLQKVEVLHKEFDSLKEIKDKRVKELNELRIVERHYSKILCMEIYKLSSSTEVPSLKDLNELQQHINMLIEEHGKRYKKYCEARTQLTNLLEINEIMPESPLEKHICSGKEPLSLSNKALEAIEEIILKAEKRKSELETEKRCLMDKLFTLWERLSIDSSIKNQFLSDHVDCKPSTLHTIQQELNKYEEMKKQNLKSFIDSVRNELLELWNVCGISDQIFPAFSSNEITEEMLLAHELELEKWKKHHDEIKFILGKIQKRNKLWDQLMAFDAKANDPARFKNRGGNLLKEERERNKLQKTLPALENEIYEGISEYETKTGKKFLYKNEDYREHIAKQWKERSNQKENLKLEKLTPSVTPSKKLKLTSPKSAPCIRYPVFKTPSAKTKMTPKTAKKPPVSRPKYIKKRDRDILKEISKNKNATSSTDDTAYSDFAKELDRTERHVYRSSVVTSKKVGGTKTPNSHKKKRKSSIKLLNTHKEHVGLTSVRGKTDLPFII